MMTTMCQVCGAILSITNGMPKTLYYNGCVIVFSAELSVFRWGATAPSPDFVGQGLEERNISVLLPSQTLIFCVSQIGRAHV